MVEPTGVIQAADTDSPFASEEEFVRWRRKLLGIEAHNIPHKGYLLREQGLHHAWIWVLANDGSLRRRVLVNSEQLLDFDDRLHEMPIALHFTVAVLPLQHAELTNFT